MLPLGPKSWQLNATTATIGMSIFFTLSGFLITTTLMYRPSVVDFAIRRCLRILPLAWLFLALVLPWFDPEPKYYLPNFLFYANLPPYWLFPVNGHFWSLGVEMQFYFGIALLFLLLRQRGLLILPLLCLAITGSRMYYGVALPHIATYFRVDEILAGACLALIVEGRLGSRLPKTIGRFNIYLWIVLLFLSCHPLIEPVNYFRPYVAATLVGATLLQEKLRLPAMLKARWLAYIAEISFALYIIHPLTTHGWFDDSNKLIKYTKRFLSFTLTFALAHISTFYYEKYWIRLGKRLTVH
jgi:peptidoglycan/LPS O-acetylase OafA/YrhL